MIVGAEQAVALDRLDDALRLTSLCRLYDDARRSVSNSYAIESTFGVGKSIIGENAMSVIPVDEPPGARTSSAQRSFWQRLAQALDAYFVDRTKSAVPEITLRRCKHDVDRLRRLMHKNSLVPVGASLSQRRSGQTTRQR